MSVNIKTSLMRKYGAGKMWSLGLGMALLMVVLMAGCAGNTRSTRSGGAPTLSSVSPSSGTQGQTVPVTLTGTNFASGATIGLSGTGITVSNTTVVGGTSITATFTIALNAPTGAQNVTVTSSGKTSGSQTFTVNLLLPMVTSTNPANGATAVPINRKITGTNFASGATIGLSGTGITVSNTTVVSGTSITATFTIASNAPTGAQNVTV